MSRNPWQVYAWLEEVRWGVVSDCQELLHVACDMPPPLEADRMTSLISGTSPRMNPLQVE